MGVAQNALLGVLGTTAAGAAAVGKVGADIKSANAAAEEVKVAKVTQAESLQKEFLQNKEALNYNETQMKPLEKAASAGNSGPAHRLGYTDRQAAQVALQQMQEKQVAIREVNARRAEQYAQLIGKTSIGGER